MNKPRLVQIVSPILVLITLLTASLACSGTAPTKVNSTEESPTNTVIEPEKPISKTQTNSVSTQPVSQSSVALTILPYQYKLTDIGDGWNRGEVSLVFENKSKEVVIPGAMMLSQKGAIVQTKEGPTYPITTFKAMSLDKGDLWGIDLLDQQDIREIFPGFRFMSISYGYYLLEWKSATAATPTRVEFIDEPKLSFDLPTQSETLPQFPFDNPPTELKSIASLAGVKLIDDPKGIQSTYTGRCVISNSTFGLEINSVNNDKFSEKTGQFILGSREFTVFTRGGVLSYNNLYLFPELSLGPGVSQLGNVYLTTTNEDLPFYVILRTTAGYDLFEVKDCVPGK